MDVLEKKRESKSLCGAIPTVPTAYTPCSVCATLSECVCVGFSVCTVEICLWMPVWVWDLMLCTFVFEELINTAGNHSLLQSFHYCSKDLFSIPKPFLLRQSNIYARMQIYEHNLKSISQNMHVGAHIHSMLRGSCSSCKEAACFLLCCPSLSFALTSGSLSVSAAHGVWLKGEEKKITWGEGSSAQTPKHIQKLQIGVRLD